MGMPSKKSLGIFAIEGGAQSQAKAREMRQGGHESWS
jgi:hypothetical protein